MKEKNIIYACERHIDMAFDDYLVDNESFPELEKADSKHKCSYCEKEAEYELL
ncbi:MAG: CxxH/CxxC protein [Clostridium sp.]|nr:CxxH/CxxC protein [Clostridium sp.]